MPHILEEWIAPLRSSCENNEDGFLNHPIWTLDEFYMKFQSLEHFFSLIQIRSGPFEGLLARFPFPTSDTPQI